MSKKPSIRWGIITTGKICQWFVGDIMIDRPDAPVEHIIQAVGTSSMSKAEDFAQKFCPNQTPKLYDSYQGCYDDPDVDVVYIGSPHGFHKRDCLAAIAAGKNILCEKAFTMNAREAREVFEAAEQRGVYVHEAMWLRHRPLVQELRKLLFEEKAIGEVFRTFCDFGLYVDVPSLPSTSRHKDLQLGAGTLLDKGVYSLTWGILTLDHGSPHDSEKPKISAALTLNDGVDITDSILLHYPSTGCQGIITSSTNTTGELVFARIQGTKGQIEVEGIATAMPTAFTVYANSERDKDLKVPAVKPEGRRYEFPVVGRGFTYEADNTALDILAGKKESQIMPWAETIRVMEIMDEVRRQGGLKYPADDE